jgi:hypothetical protein
MTVSERHTLRMDAMEQKSQWLVVARSTSWPTAAKGKPEFQRRLSGIQFRLLATSPRANPVMQPTTNVRPESRGQQTLVAVGPRKALSWAGERVAPEPAASRGASECRGRRSPAPGWPGRRRDFPAGRDRCGAIRHLLVFGLRSSAEMPIFRGQIATCSGRSDVLPGAACQAFASAPCKDRSPSSVVQSWRAASSDPAPVPSPCGCRGPRPSAPSTGAFNR